MDPRMVDYNIYRRTYKTDNVEIDIPFETNSEKRFLSLFQQEENVNILARMLIQRIDIHEKKLLPLIRLDIQNFIKNWIGLGKFSKGNLMQTSSVQNQISFYNKMFIDVFEHEFRKKYDYTFDSNPFFEVINGKKREDFRPEDYASLDVQQNRTTFQRESLNKKRDTIKFYEKAIYRRHYADNKNDSSVTHGSDRNALIYTDGPKFEEDIKKIDDRSSNSEDLFEKESFTYGFSKKEFDLLKK